MLILILGIALVALVVFGVLTGKYPSYSNKYGAHSFCLVMSCVFGVIVLGSIISICCLLPTVATESTIDSKIEMYQEENTNIEQDINKIIKEYLVRKYDTSTDLKKEENLINLVTVFPELKSDTLVQQKLEIYSNNNGKIKSLKEKKIDMSKIKWILYFGK